LVPWLRDSTQPCFGSLAEAGKEARVRKRV
jgi:hypothetical protein